MKIPSVHILFLTRSPSVELRVCCHLGMSRDNCDVRPDLRLSVAPHLQEMETGETGEAGDT